MIGLLLAGFFALVASASLAGLYLAWPRPMTPDEWIDRRHAAERGQRVRPPLTEIVGAAILGSWPVARVRWAVGLMRADLDLLRTRGPRPLATDELVTVEFVRLALGGIAIGLALGFVLWLVGGGEGIPVPMALFGVAFGALFPTLRWFQIRREAARLRAAIRRRLPRLLTASRVLLESGLTPQAALTTAVYAYSDPAADLLREALRDSQARRVELPVSLEEIGQSYRLEPLLRLADGFRVGGRFGTRMAELLTGFAEEERHIGHAEYREHMARAPVLMTVPALIFFVLPLLVLVLVLIVSPLISGLGQI